MHHGAMAHRARARSRQTAKKPPKDMMSLWAQTPEQHAFVMCGTKTLFLAHLTMFHMEEHCYQLVMRARLSAEAMKQYVADRKKYPNACYFLGNIPSDGMEVPDFQTGRRVAFIGDVFRGITFHGIPKSKHWKVWPWAHQRPVIHNTLVTIERVVYFRHFDFNLEYPKTLTYLLFGAGDEAFLDHYQVREPDFDQVLALKKAPKWLPKPLLESGLDINFPGTRTVPTPCSNPIRPGHHVIHYGEKRKRTIVVDQNYWFCTKVVNAEDPCARRAR